MQEYRAIGVMSGTSLDGLDIAFCRFIKTENQWQFLLEEAVTIPYSSEWKARLENLMNRPKTEIKKADLEYGELIGTEVEKFASQYGIRADLICSHGHTIFHQPEKGFTLQVGNGKSIADICRTTTINDFRSLDVSLGGQGAPLVPIGDKLLFSDFEFCLNLGGFANVSFDNKNGERIAFDICPANLPLNYLAKKLHYELDKNGTLARSGNVDESVLEKLNSLSFYAAQPPKSLGKEWLDKEFTPIIESNKSTVNDKLRTVSEHIAIQISKAIPSSKGKLLVTGGGAFNTFLMERISALCKHEVVVPQKKIVAFKEALVFAFLGVLRYRNETNCLASVTGAKSDCSGGVIHEPMQG